jgi:hypothetical protein
MGRGCLFGLDMTFDLFGVDMMVAWSYLRYNINNAYQKCPQAVGDQIIITEASFRLPIA